MDFEKVSAYIESLYELDVIKDFKDGVVSI